VSPQAFRNGWRAGPRWTSLPRVPTLTRRLVEADIDQVVAFSLAAWAPVFAALEEQLGAPIFRMIFPDWTEAQGRAVRAVCLAPENEVWVAVDGDRPVGFVAIGFIAEDAARAGEIYMIAVDPDHQRRGVATALMHRALGRVEAAGVDLAVIATGGDPGHAPARALYERFDFTPLEQVRYYRKA
jgi:ribosomal protein S18 acetylase RimI-like enzyme